MSTWRLAACRAKHVAQIRAFLILVVVVGPPHFDHLREYARGSSANRYCWNICSPKRPWRHDRSGGIRERCGLIVSARVGMAMSGSRGSVSSSASTASGKKADDGSRNVYSKVIIPLGLLPSRISPCVGPRDEHPHHPPFTLVILSWFSLSLSTLWSGRVRYGLFGDSCSHTARAHIDPNFCVMLMRHGTVKPQPKKRVDWDDVEAQAKQEAMRLLEWRKKQVSAQLCFALDESFQGHRAILNFGDHQRCASL